MNLLSVPPAPPIFSDNLGEFALAVVGLIALAAAAIFLVSLFMGPPSNMDPSD